MTKTLSKETQNLLRPFQNLELSHSLLGLINPHEPEIDEVKPLIAVFIMFTAAQSRNKGCSPLLVATSRELQRTYGQSIFAELVNHKFIKCDVDNNPQIQIPGP